MADETIFYEGRIPTRVFIFSHGFFWIVFLGWNVGLLAAFFHSFTWHIRITSQRLVLSRGFISRSVEEIEYYRVSDTSAEQNFLQRLAGVGTLTLLSEDLTAPKLTFPVHSPYEFREKIRTSVREERSKMRTVNVD